MLRLKQETIKFYLLNKVFPLYLIQSVCENNNAGVVLENGNIVGFEQCA